MSQTTVVRLANRTLTVHTSRLDSYLKRGYDEINENGDVIQRATGGKAISIQEHNKALDRIAELEEQLEGAGDQTAFEELKKELSVVKGKLTKAENELKAKG